MQKKVSADTFWHSIFEYRGNSNQYRRSVSETSLTVVETTWMGVSRLDHGSEVDVECRRPYWHDSSRKGIYLPRPLGTDKAGPLYSQIFPPAPFFDICFGLRNPMERKKISQSNEKISTRSTIHRLSRYKRSLSGQKSQRTTEGRSTRPLPGIGSEAFRGRMVCFNAQEQ